MDEHEQPEQQTVTVEVNPPELEQPEPVTHSLPESAPSETPAEFQALVAANHKLTMQRLDQLEKLCQSLTTRFTSVMDEMEQTTALAQEMIGRIDETTEKAGQQTAALVKVTGQLAQIVAAIQAGARH